MSSTAVPSRNELRADPHSPDSHIVGSYDPARRWLGLVTLTFSLLAITTDMTILNVAIPQMSADLQPTASQQLWIIDAYSLVMAGLLISMSSIADRWGRKRMLLLGYVLIALASVLVLFAHCPGFVIALRVLLGIGAAMVEEFALAYAAQRADDVTATPEDAWSWLLAGADLVVTCTGAVGHVIEADALGRARDEAGRESTPAVLLDLALPRDVDPTVTGLPGVRLWALADLQREMASGHADGDADAPGTGPPADGGQGAARPAGTAEAVEAVRDLVTAEVATYLTERRVARLGPTLAALRAQAARVVDQEMVRLDQRVPHLPQDERAEVRRTVQRVVDKLLHTPSVRVKQLQHGGEPADYGQALRELFDLDPAEPAAVRTAPPEVTVAPITEASLPAGSPSSSRPASREVRP